jgi:hypothetical protein
VEREQETGVLVRRRHDLVVRSEVEPRDDDVAAVGGRPRERDLGRRDSDETCKPLAHALSQSEDAVEVPFAQPSALTVGTELDLHRVDGRSRQRAEGAGVQVRRPLEHREEPARLLEGHSIVTSTGA